MPLQSIPIMLANQKKVAAAAAPNFNSIVTKNTSTYQTKMNYSETMQEYQDHSTTQNLMQVDNSYRFARESFNQGYGSRRQKSTFQRHTAMYEDIALPAAVLNEYYSQVWYALVPNLWCQISKVCFITTIYLSFVLTESWVCSAGEGQLAGV